LENGPREQLAKHLDRLQEYNRITGTAEIARRYLAMNAFDGVLTIIGVLVGSYVAGVRDPMVVIRTGVATSIAVGVSGLWGAYLTESAERGRELDELECVTLTDLAETKIGRASRFAAVAVSIVDGLAPFVASLIVLIPFFLAFLIDNVLLVYGLSAAVGLMSLFGLGLFLGRISGRNVVAYGLRTLVAGLVSIGLSFLLAGPAV